MSIPFTQYLRPYGDKRDITIDRSERVEALALDLAKRGVRFETEVLRTLEVSFEAVIEEAGEVRSLAQVIVPNGPGVPEAVDVLVRNAAQRLGLGEGVIGSRSEDTTT